MKIQRYDRGRSNVALLREKQSNLRSPEAVAQEAYAPYGAIADVADTAADALMGMRERDLQLQREEDEQALKMIDIRDKARLNAMKSDPKYNNQMQPDGTPTASTFLEDVEEHFGAQQKELDQIQDPKLRMQAQEVMAVNQEASRAWARAHINDKREGWAMQNDYALLDVMIEGQAFGDARKQVDEMVGKKRMSDARRRAYDNIIDADETAMAAEENLSQYQTLIAAGRGDEALAQVLESPHENKKVQDATVAGIKAGIVNYDVITKQQKDALTAKWMRETSDLITSLENPKTTIDVDALFKTMVGEDLNEVKAATLANQVATAQRNRTVKESKQDVFMEQLQAGYEFDNNTTNQIGVDGYLDSQRKAAKTDPEMANMTDEEIEISTYRTTGLVGKRRQTEMQNASSAANIARQAEFFNALHSDTYLETKDGLSSQKRSLYERIARRAQYGELSWGEATQVVMEMEDVDEVTRDMRKQKFVNDDGQELAGDYYDKLFNDKYDSDIPFYTGIDNVNHEENEARYQMYLQDGLTLTGEWEDAEVHANRMFEDSHVITNINGKREMQVGGIPSKQDNGTSLDLSGLRQNFVSKVSDRKFLVTNEDGTSDIGTIGLDGTTFEDPREEYGETTYNVHSYGNPVINPDTGNALTVTIDDGDIRDLVNQQASSYKLVDFRESQAIIQKDIDEIDAEIKRGEARGIDMSIERERLKGFEQAMMEKAKAFKNETGKYQ